MSTLRMGLRPSVRASSPVPSFSLRHPFAKLRIRLIRYWLRWRCRRDPAEAGYRLLRLDDPTLAALGLSREAIRRELLHLDSSHDPENAENAEGAPSDERA